MRYAALAGPCVGTRDARHEEHSHESANASQGNEVHTHGWWRVRCKARLPCPGVGRAHCKLGGVAFILAPTLTSDSSSHTSTGARERVHRTPVSVALSPC